MPKGIQRKTRNLEISLYHHELIKIIITHELEKKGVVWPEFLATNGFDVLEYVSRNVVEK